eukprot:86650-Ditylum_brightwellii.AAC.1
MMLAYLCLELPFDFIQMQARMRLVEHYTKMARTNHKSPQVLKQKITISQDYGAEMMWVKGTDNGRGDTMTRLPTMAQMPAGELVFEEKEAFFLQHLFKMDEIFPID